MHVDGVTRWRPYPNQLGVRTRTWAVLQRRLHWLLYFLSPLLYMYSTQTLTKKRRFAGRGPL